MKNEQNFEASVAPSSEVMKEIARHVAFAQKQREKEETAERERKAKISIRSLNHYIGLLDEFSWEHDNWESFEEEFGVSKMEEDMAADMQVYLKNREYSQSAIASYDRFQRRYMAKKEEIKARYSKSVSDE